MDLRSTDADANRIRALAQELVGLQPDIILAGGSPAIVALQRETQTIPIVFVNRPSGNVTGFSALEATLGGKWLELLSEIAPGLKRAAIMFNPDMATASAYMPSFETAARSLKVVPIIAPVHSDGEIERPLSPLGASREAALSS
jgi:putative ABC transport system substrate-binding protein